MLSALDGAILIAAAGLQLMRLAGVLAHARRRARRRHLDLPGLADMFSNPLIPGLALVVIVESWRTSLIADIRALLGARYPQLEVVVALPEHAGDALHALAEAFGAGDGPVRTAATGTLTLVAPGGDAVVTADAALAAARHPLVCVLRDDWRPDEDALLRLARPFVDADESTGVTLARVAPTGSSRRRQAVVGVFRRSEILEAGGLGGLGGLGGERELAQRIGRRRRARGLGSAIVDVPDAIVHAAPAEATRHSRGRPRAAIDRLAALQIAAGAFVACSVAIGSAPAAWLVLYALVAVGFGAVVSVADAIAVPHRISGAPGARG